MLPHEFTSSTTRGCHEQRTRSFELLALPYSVGWHRLVLGDVVALELIALAHLVTAG